MQIIHHIGLRAGHQERMAFSSVGFDLPIDRTGLGVISFQIAEDDPRWHGVRSLCKHMIVAETVTTRFTGSELAGADYLGLVASSHHGYPEPREEGGYLRASFDLSAHCRMCGIGARQVAPFRLKRPPLAGKTSILQLNWVFDEYFVDAEVWASAFEPLGIGSWPVLLHKTGGAIRGTVQLRIDAVCPVETTGLTPVRCVFCGRVKHRYLLRGPHPKPIRPSAPVFHSSQYFGAGGQAFRLVFVSAEVFRAIRQAGLRGVRFYPCA